MDIFPYFYILVTSAMANWEKPGTTWHPETRKGGYATSFPTPPVYAHVFRLDPTAFPSKSSLYYIDSVEWPNYLRSIKREDILSSEGGGREWIHKTPETASLVRAFLAHKGIAVLEEITNDPFPIRAASPNDGAEEESKAKQVLKETLSQTDSLLGMFMALVMKGKQMRRIQRELWDIFSAMCATTEKMKGIVQWPTGVGKTYAILLMIILAKTLRQRTGPFRAVIVAPQNNILSTLERHFALLSHFGLIVLKGFEGELSSLEIPTEKPFVLLATHQGLLQQRGESRLLEQLPRPDMLLYDEVHHISGDVFYEIMMRQLRLWQPDFLLGTSATPLTKNPEQRARLNALFECDLANSRIHYCDYLTAIREGWIAPLRFDLNIYDCPRNSKGVLKRMAQKIQALVEERKMASLWRNGKFIVNDPSSLASLEALQQGLREELPSQWKMFSAADIPCDGSEKDFMKAPCDATPRALFSCQRCREGSDFDGIEFTAVSMGQSIEPHIFVQLAGRTMRLDYPEKIADLIIFRQQQEKETPEQIIYDLYESLTCLVGGGGGGQRTRKSIEAEVETLFGGEVTVNGVTWTAAMTTESIQRIYTRNTMNAVEPRLRYDRIRSINQEMGLKSRAEYIASRDVHPYYVEYPQTLFAERWGGWYDFLGRDVTAFPKTKEEFIETCRARGIYTWADYRATCSTDLPELPEELYTDYRNWDDEFGITGEVLD